MNGVQFTAPDVPVLLQILSGAHTAQELLPKGSFLVVERNKTVQINFPSGLIGGPHPFHLHGVLWILTLFMMIYLPLILPISTPSMLSEVQTAVDSIS